MKVLVVKSDKESNERLVSRFNKVVQGSRKVLKVRSERYHSRKATKRHVRAAAVMRDFHRTSRKKSMFY